MGSVVRHGGLPIVLASQEPLHKHHVPVFVRSGHCLVQRWRPRRSSGAMEGDPYRVVCYGQPATGNLDPLGENDQLGFKELQMLDDVGMDIDITT